MSIALMLLVVAVLMAGDPQSGIPNVVLWLFLILFAVQKTLVWRDRT